MLKLKLNKRGQNTVEYLLMLTVLVGVVMIVGAALKSRFPTIVNTVVDFINNGVTQSTK